MITIFGLLAGATRSVFEIAFGASAVFILSPVGISLWGLILGVLDKYPNNSSVFGWICLFLACVEIAYVVTLTLKRDQLRMNIVSGPSMTETTASHDSGTRAGKFFTDARRYWQMKIIAVLGTVVMAGIFCIALLVVLEKPEDLSAIKEVFLVGPEDAGAKTYRLEIPNAYLISPGGRNAMLRTAYPGMVRYTPETRYRFYRKRGPSVDYVKIFMEIKGGKGKSADRDDPGRLALKNQLLKFPDSYKQVPVFDTIKESEKIAHYVSSKIKSDEGDYVITHEDRRISIIKCRYKFICNARTTWRGEFSIDYDFNRKYFDKMVDLDRSVVALIDSFKPAPMDSPP